MKELTSARWIIFKGLLFLFVGILSAVLLVLEQMSLKVVLLLAVAIWCFCRFYYFAFYVIERYLDPGYRHSGLWALAVYLFSRRRGERPRK